MMQEINDLKTEIREVEAELLQKTQQLEKAEAENARLVKRVDELEQAVSELNSYDAPAEVQQLRGENARLREALIDARDSFLSLQPDFNGDARASYLLERIIKALAASPANDGGGR